MTPAGNKRGTERLILRRWREADHEPFAALNADPDVMDYFPVLLTRAESDQMIARIEAGFDQRGYGLWALELRATGEFIGFTGLDIPSLEAHFHPGRRGWLGAWRGPPGTRLCNRGRLGIAAAAPSKKHTRSVPARSSRDHASTRLRESPSSWINSTVHADGHA
jgi:hypothetical protein